ncbi:MAG: fold metallo-hydrolase [Ignavibacteria bacterium]|nr:fold metallo-hydrolase [Ignavibacteria bacterium]
MKFGKFSIDVIDTTIFSLDGGAMFGVVPKTMWSKAYHPGDENNRIPMAARPMLVRWESHNLLVDCGNGTKLSEKLTKIYGIDNEKSALAPHLVKFGLKPDDITDVVLTHLHFDHSGGATDMQDGKVVPAFPNAKYYVQKKHLEWARNPTEKDRASFFPENYEPIAAEGMFELIDGDGELFEGINLITANGHTSTMQMVQIDSGERKLIYVADFCPTSAHIHIPFVMGYDNMPLISLEEKRRLIPQAYEENSIFVFEHDAFVQAATIASNEKGFSVKEKIEISK